MSLQQAMLLLLGCLALVCGCSKDQDPLQDELAVTNESILETPVLPGFLWGRRFRIAPSPSRAALVVRLFQGGSPVSAVANHGWPGGSREAGVWRIGPDTLRKGCAIELLAMDPMQEDVSSLRFLVGCLMGDEHSNTTASVFDVVVNSPRGRPGGTTWVRHDFVLSDETVGVVEFHSGEMAPPLLNVTFSLE